MEQDKNNSVDGNQNPSSVRSKTHRAVQADGETGFVSRPRAADFLRQLATHIDSVLDGKKIKVTVDIQEK